MNIKDTVAIAIKNHRLIGIILTALYSVAYDYITREFLFDSFAYLLNYDYNPMTPDKYAVYIVICTFPFVLYKGFNYLASIISLFSHLFIFIPFCNTLFVAGYPIGITTAYIVFFLIAQCAFYLTDNKFLGKKDFSLTSKIPFSQFEVIVYFLLIIAVALNFQKMHMVNIFNSDEKELLYDLRAENSESSFAFNNYLLVWLNHILLPILMVCYLRVKNYKKLAVVFAGMLFVFMVDMQKISFLIPFVIVLFYYLYTAYPRGYLNYFHVMLIIGLIVLPLVAIEYKGSSLGFTICAILIMRTQCIAGRQFATYFNFFEMQDHPYTYFTHINIINKITGAYPYAESLGKTVSYGEANSNATFYLMDGIAGCGLVGCIIVAILFIIFKSYFNTIGLNYNKSLCVTIIFFSISSLMNVSLFTSLLTGGFLLFYILCRKVDFPQLRDN